MSFELRHILSASLISAALALPAAAQTETATEENAPAAQATESTADASQTDAEAPVIQEDLFLGEESAPLTIYEYASFTCPHCAAFHEDGYKKLKAEYIDTGKVRFALRDVYFDQVGLWAGIMARCEPAKFYPVADMLMGEQAEWLKAENGEELVANLRKIGAKSGMTPEQMDSCWNDEARVTSLIATFQQNAETDKIDSTPTFMIGGEQVSNMPWDELKAKIDEKLAEAEAAQADTASN